MRKALVNDVVVSFVWCLHHRHSWPSPLLDCVVPAWKKQEDDLSVRAYFAAYAFKHQPNHIFAYGAIVLLAPWLSFFTEPERGYAQQLLEKYYVNSRRVGLASEHQPESLHGLVLQQDQ